MMVLFLGGCAKAEVQETEYTDEVEEKEISICQDNSIVNDESASVHDADFEIILGSLYADFVYDEEELPSEVVDNRIGTVMVNDEAHDWFFHNYTDFSIYTTDYNHVIGDFSGKHVYIMQIVLHTPRFKTEKGIAVGAKLDELSDAYENKLICDENEVYRNIEGNVVTQFVVKQEIVEEIHLYYRENTQTYPEVYHNVCEQEDIRKVALLYLDEDTIPELLTIQEGKYRLYTVRDDAVEEIALDDAKIEAPVCGLNYEFMKNEQNILYWFEYVPYEGLVRIHSDWDGERHDYYLRYTDGVLIMELEANSEMKDAEFTAKISELGYDELLPCAYMYDDIKTAYENIARTTDTQKALDAFVNGETKALCFVEEVPDVWEDGFVMKSYEELFEHITAGDDAWGDFEYVDFDNDGEDELILHGYAGASMFFDVIGDTVYLLLTTGSTTDVASVAMLNGKNVIERTDLTHVGRKNYRIITLDACGCPIDYFHLYTGYEGDTYSPEDVFEYRNEEISMEEFEEILAGIQPLTEEK